MHVLAIDVGSYSIKYVSSFVEKRKVTHVEMSEIIVHDFLADHPDLPFQEAQLKIVQEIFDSVARPDTKILYQVDNEMMTTRFLTLPIKSKKKAELMLPFQLEEDIPYALNEIHYAYRMESQKTQHTALVELVRDTTFEGFYASLKEKNILPNILTTEASITENFFNQNPIAGPFCVLNIGHRTTRAYFFFNSRMIATNVSYVAGKEVNEMIAQTYKIDPEEALMYKHQNAFFLTAGQYEGVEPAQKDFALAMDKVFAPLVSDFARWKVGFKVNYGLTISHVFICGGSSNIKNIANYLTEKWDTKVSLLESFDKVEVEKIDVSANNKTKYALANMMALGFRKKNRFINLLIGKFTQASTSELPLHSFTFIGVRVLAASVVFAISLMAERVFIERDIKAVNLKINAVMKNEELQVSGRLRRSIANNPKPVFDALVKNQRAVRQEISTLQSAIEIQALSPLLIVSQVGASTDGTLIEFSSNDLGEVTAIFSAETPESLNKIKAAFERSNLNDVTAQVDQTKQQVTVKASGN